MAHAVPMLVPAAALPLSPERVLAAVNGIVGRAPGSGAPPAAPGGAPEARAEQKGS